jgi:hypothetical protein
MSVAGNPVFKGAWVAATAYVLDDVVMFDDRQYVCINASGSTGNRPDTDAVPPTFTGTYWSVIATEPGVDGLKPLTYVPQAPTASAPAFIEGGMYYDTTLMKLRIGGATGWETVTSA